MNDKQLNELTVINHLVVDGDTSLIEQYLRKFVDQWIEVLFSVKHDDISNIHQIKNALSRLGKSEQQILWKLNDALKIPLQKIMNGQYSGDKVNNLLKTLQAKITQLKPPENNKIRFKDWFFLLFSWKQNAWQLWLENYHDLKKEINISQKILETEKNHLLGYNQLLIDKKQRFNESLQKLEWAFDVIQNISECLKKQINKEESPNNKDKNLAQDEFLTDLQKRQIELQQQLLIGRQTIMTIDVLIQQNVIQTDSIENALHNTASALDVAAGLVLAEQGRKNLNKFSDSNKKSNGAMELERLQVQIDTSLQQINKVRKTYNKSMLNSSDQ